ncbi:putative cell wall binding protein [Lachnospiraceae bacterium JC7]|nr:putative cell wall binding protein [Lachnospiraceae bacterium JC7]
MKLRSIILTTAVLMTTFALSSFASEISTVRLDLSPDAESTMGAGELAGGEEPATYDGTYFVYDYSVSGDRKTPKTSYTYTIDIHPSNGYTFSSNCAVEVNAASSVSIQSRTESRIRVKATTFPFYVLKNPSGFSESGNEISWNKVEYADKYSVYIYWEDDDGDDHETHTTVTNSKHKVNVSSYNSGTRTLKYISVQAQASGEGGKFIANSQYIRSDGGVDDDKSSSGYTFNIPLARSNSLTTSSSTTSVKNDAEKVFGPGFNLQNAPGTTGSSEGTWMQYMNEWYYLRNGQFLTGWICPDGVNWYLLGSNGAMLTGLQRVNGRWYLLNTIEGSTYGAVLAGWWKINEKWYYFNEQHDGTYGAMLTNTTTPDGLHVGSDGAWLGY